MPQKIKKRAAINRLLHGWGYVDGKWVYVPLWDPPRELTAFKQLFAAAALADGARLLSSRELSQRLNVLAGEMVTKAGRGFSTAWEDGDPICPPWPWPFPPRPQWPPIPFPWPPGPNPGPDPGPDPIHQFVEQLHPSARNAVIGSLVATIGESIGDKAVIEIGREILAAK